MDRRSSRAKCLVHPCGTPYLVTHCLLHLLGGCRRKAWKGTSTKAPVITRREDGTMDRKGGGGVPLVRVSGSDPVIFQGGAMYHHPIPLCGN